MIRFTQKTPRNTIWISAISLLCLLCAAFYSTGFHQIDEHFQILEYAGLKLGLTTLDKLPWEFHEKMRPAFQPAIAFITYKVFSFLSSPNPFWVTTALRVLSALLSFWSMVWVFLAFKKQITSPLLQQWFLWLSFLTWFLFYNHVRFSSENWAGVFFCLGVSYFFLTTTLKTRKVFFVGIFFGLSFLCRFQAALLILGFFLWLVLIFKASPAKILSLLFGFLVVSLFGILLDHWLYGDWPLTALNYFKQNIVINKVDTFGVNPWWFYIKKLCEDAIPPFSLMIPVSFLAYFFIQPKGALTWALIPFLVVHFLIGHKETRFLFPLIGLVPFIVIYFLQFLETKTLSFDTPLAKKAMGTYLFLNLFFSLFVILRPAKGNIALYHSLYELYPEPTVLYYRFRDPYFEVNSFHFYSRPTLKTQKTSSFSTIPKLTTQRSLLASTLFDRELEAHLNAARIYATYPDWLYVFHDKGWIRLGNTFFIDEVVR